MVKTLIFTVTILLSHQVACSETQETPRYNVVQLSGTERLDSLTSSIANVWSIVSSGLIAAVLVTGALYLIGSGGLLGGEQVVRRQSQVQYPGHGQYHDQYPGHYTGHRWSRRQEGVVQRLEKILSFLSPDSLQDVVSSVKHEVLGSLSNMKDDSIKRVDDATNALTDSFDSLGGESKLEDCFLQAICYLTPDDESSEAGEGRKNRDKQKLREEKKREKKKNKEKKNKKNKKKEKEKLEDEYYDEYYDDDIFDEDEEIEDDEEDVEVTSEDCEVFKCDMVRYGYQMFQLYDKVQTLRQKISSLNTNDLETK